MHVTTAQHWAAVDAQRARLAAHRTEQHQRHGAAMREVAGVWAERAAELLPSTAMRGEIRAAADRRAALMSERIDALGVMTPEALHAWLCSQVAAMQARPFAPFSRKKPRADQLAGMLKRAQCPLWWRRQLKRTVTQAGEAEAIHAGLVSKYGRQVYCSDETVRRRALDVASSQAMLAATEIEDEDGNVITLKAAFDASPSSKPIRRGELMTRIRGCEEWAEANGMVGLFPTCTAPSRFHSQGGRNPKYQGATPRDAHDWHIDVWKRCRSALGREGVKFMGFRVAEPHADGCPHWHMLVWVRPQHVGRFKAILHRWWRLDEGNEQGAAKRRVTIKTMEPGGATGYVAKYVSKNIDDAGSVGVEGHRDEWESEASAQGDLFGGTAARVEAWASCWGIRQFQSFGQPPVTVWRELRRVSQEAADVAPAPVQFMWDGVHRAGDRRACWFTYLELQGGPNVGRAYRVHLARRKEEFEGRYEREERALPVGVYDAARPDVLVPSARRKWRPREHRAGGYRHATVSPGVGPMGAGQPADAGPAGGQGAKRAAPWTRFNNCTRGNFGGIVAELQRRAFPLSEWAGGPSQRSPNGPPDPRNPFPRDPAA